MYVENISISLEQLGYKPFKGLIIDSGIWIKKIEINIDQTLLGGLTWENERKCYAHVTYDIRGRIVTVFVRVLLAFRHWIRFVFTQARSKIKPTGIRIGPPIKSKNGSKILIEECVDYARKTPKPLPYHSTIFAFQVWGLNMVCIQNSNVPVQLRSFEEGQKHWHWKLEVRIRLRCFKAAPDSDRNHVVFLAPQYFDCGRARALILERHLKSWSGRSDNCKGSSSFLTSRATRIWIDEKPITFQERGFLFLQGGKALKF